MNRLFDWLEERKTLNYVLVLVYLVAIILLHDAFVKFSVSVMKAIGGVENYNLMVAIAVGLVTLALGAWFLRSSFSINSATTPKAKIWPMASSLLVVAFQSHSGSSAGRHR